MANHFGAPVKDQSIESLRNNERLIAFLDDANINVLSASVEKMNDGSVKYHIDNVWMQFGQVKKGVFGLCQHLEAKYTGPWLKFFIYFFKFWF